LVCEVSLDFSTVSRLDDICTTTGFLRAITYVLALEPGSEIPKRCYILNVVVTRM
jgi:hypothetical protein